jgi:hypothetical protein
VIDLLKMGVDPNSEKVARLIREASVYVVETPGYDPFAGCTEDEKCEWHVFMLFLACQHGWLPQGAAQHVEWVLQRPFVTVTEWMGEEGDKFRNTQRMNPVTEKVKQQWQDFAAEYRGRDLPSLFAELTALEKVWEPTMRGSGERENSPR